MMNFGIRSFFKNRELIWQLSKREVSLRYSGSFLGVVWSFINPLMMLIVYSFVFGTVFGARWHGIDGDNSNFALLMFIGLLLHGLFAECLLKSTTLIIANTNYVKKVIFPLEILPWTVLGSAIFHFMAGLVVLLILQVILIGRIEVTVCLLPIIVLPYVIGLMGISWFAAALGVYFRDLTQIGGTISSVMLFLSPIFYSVDTIPEQYRGYILMNPLTSVIEQSRNVIVYGKYPEMMPILYICSVSAILYILGILFFNKTRKGFSDVL
ncbi:ABC transporter permease [Brucella intermedia]|nr:ABC transporter permease [Brucella intermedia]